MGQTFQEVGDRDAEYVRWALGQVSPFGQIARFHDYLLNKPSRLDMPEAHILIYVFFFERIGTLSRLLLFVVPITTPL